MTQLSNYTTTDCSFASVISEKYCSCVNEQVSVAVALQPCIREVLGSNTDCHDGHDRGLSWLFLSFSLRVREIVPTVGHNGFLPHHP
jgi:hypothetical protein